MPEKYDLLDRRFEKLISSHADVEQLYTGCRFAEGPAYFAGGRYLIWSDIPNNRLLRYDETDGSVSVFRQPSGYANGNTVDRVGRLISCEHGTRKVTRTEHNGAITTLAENWNGKRLNSPNDVVVKSDETIWFTDPPYGIDDDYSGNKGESEIGASHVYRINLRSGIVEAAITDMVRPNGLAFSPDERKLYVVDSGRTHGLDYPAHIRVFNVDDDNRVSGGTVFAEATVGIFDGMRIDTDGRIWTSAGDGVHAYEPDGTLIGKIRVPEVVGNLCFGGARNNILYICATKSLYAVHLLVKGVRTY
ncbi:SMP-30/gluconolactonase/LRE family protein [Microvirga tunisiensis]|uniref:SMP-30/gluconolactonase/LRE family protein n=1 Tax=Microvirga tunisiensis TaxID=2108360 RepID=A0A5N7MG11_9HYPH|nr:SMP-30/gluconolactonase/LRE family protein [Microvirga tunisiensis]MPR08693.1 SMP-30/gluconolactonase/LRE family protein [Microvirga tunisiensis]MPR25982.1 SMP-30/gluconolactonase/LRE family protein [Microvirga tunisiensis]